MGSSPSQTKSPAGVRDPTGRVLSRIHSQLNRGAVEESVEEAVDFALQIWHFGAFVSSPAQ